ncbi:hypothetical protein E2C00_03840 [Streptomyces sp. WAC05374]|uniref:DUF6332 family protein n=1 Tax=Streptomyces sp. WAC05374 TaxID=2487420 RepID=UPI000F869F2F|nr:DUF6332 family protein [Streptomyces sp. WAC05374]RST04989.1 hypothetical protein EF905_33400 [Streptomyces sp. WAC05374]TDF50612.1 hypothetical protein E2B92_03825 [Streptomyces sp. WAC05374]TDF56902.1 hypothetical protein E2C02_10635 [Streptomyces sp. WAC05374]TDF60865.1 hypothetical protein E2C00_03840 [Streptomyces sp. WAC05374]
MGNRTQAQRDAMTVEIGYALLTAAFLAAALFGLCAAPVLVLGLEGGAARGTLMVAAAVAGLGFVARVARVLWRFGAGPDGLPDRPGRTGPGA